MRRHFLGLAASTVFAPAAFSAAPSPPASPLNFRIMRKSDRIGTHAVSFSGNAQALTVDIAVEMAVSFGPVRLFHYNHHNVEHWVNGRFDSMAATTDYDGEPAWCRVHRHGETLMVEGSKTTSYEAKSDVLPATHWNKAELNGPMINPENGMLLRPVISDMGRSDIALASGQHISATHYGWRGQDELDLWYDAQNVWAALQAVTKSGETISYERL